MFAVWESEGVDPNGTTAKNVWLSYLYVPLQITKDASFRNPSLSCTEPERFFGQKGKIEIHIPKPPEPNT
jgi:hypothetical protein